MSNVPGLSFALGEDIDMLRDTLVNFASKEIAPRAAEIDPIAPTSFRWTCGRSSAISACSA